MMEGFEGEGFLQGEGEGSKGKNVLVAGW